MTLIEFPSNSLIIFKILKKNNFFISNSIKKHYLNGCECYPISNLWKKHRGFLVFVSLDLLLFLSHTLQFFHSVTRSIAATISQFIHPAFIWKPAGQGPHLRLVLRHYYHCFATFTSLAGSWTSLWAYQPKMFIKLLCGNAYTILYSQNKVWLLPRNSRN